MKLKAITFTILFITTVLIYVSYFININEKSNSLNSSESINSSKNEISDKKEFKEHVETKINTVPFESLSSNEEELSVPVTSETSNSTKESISVPITSKTSNSDEDTADSNTIKKTFELQLFLSNLPCNNYILKKGETLSTIAHKYENTCNPNTTVKLISLINHLDTPDDLKIGANLSIPESTIKSGTLYRVVTGDTWHKIALEYYPDYTPESIINFIVTINNLPNNDLPLYENVFLPLV